MKKVKGKLSLTGILAITLLFVLPSVFKYFSLNKTDGVVIRMNEGQFHSVGGGSTNFQFPTIQFKWKDSVCFYAKDNEVLFSTPKVGDKVTVVYNDKDITESYLDRFGSFWFSLPQLLIFVLLCIAWLGICGIVFASGVKS